MKTFSVEDLNPTASMDSAVYADITRHTSEDYVDHEGKPVEGTIRVDDLDRLHPETFRRLQALYAAALNNVVLAENELPLAIQTRLFQTGQLFQTGDIEEHNGKIDVRVRPGSLAAPYNHSMIDHMGLGVRPPTVGDLRQQAYSGENTLLSGGVNNFILSEVDGQYVIRMLALQRNAVSNDFVTPLADALKLQSPGGGRVESVVDYPLLGATETKEEVMTNPTLKLGRAIVNLPWLNPVRVRSFVGDTLVSEFSANPFIDKDNNTLEAYQVALHPVDVSTAEDQHAPDAVLLDNGDRLARARGASLVSLDEIATLAAIDQHKIPELEFIRDKDGKSTGIVRAAVLEHLRSTKSVAGIHEAEPIGVTPQIASLVDSGLVGRLVELQHFINASTSGRLWAANAMRQYKASA